MKKLKLFLSSVACLLLLTASFQSNAATVKGRVWNDTNTNGLQESGENGRPFVWVQLELSNGSFANGMYTDNDGKYQFTGITGNYRIKFTNPGGLYQTRPNVGSNDNLDSDTDLYGATKVFSLTGTQTKVYDAGFSTQAFACFTPILTDITNKQCSPNGQTWSFNLTATGGTGNWGWDLPSQGIFMNPYGVAHTFGPYPIGGGAVTLTISDHDNPDCTATVTVSPPNCGGPSGVLTMQCAGSVNVTATAGSSTAIANYSNPTATSTCTTGSVTVTRTQGPASGSAFPIGTTAVCYKATDGCGNEKTCCFNVVVTAGATGTLTFNCAPDVTVYTDAGQNYATYGFPLPTATSTCTTGSVTVVQTSGTVAGGHFALGANQVCFKATDGCGNTKTCCYRIIVEQPCDTKICNYGGSNIIFDLLTVNVEANNERTYCMRVTNLGSTPLMYVAFGLPNGVSAAAPANGSTYVAPSGRSYEVRNPNYSPFFSIRFKVPADEDGIKNGQSDIFKYSLPQQSNPWYFNAITRVQPKVFCEVIMNTVDCMPSSMQANNTNVGEQIEDAQQVSERGASAFSVFPNPADQYLLADLTAFEGQSVNVQLFNAQGQLVSSLHVMGSADPLQIDLKTVAAGVYHLRVLPTSGKPETLRVVVTH